LINKKGKIGTLVPANVAEVAKLCKKGKKARLYLRKFSKQNNIFKPLKTKQLISKAKVGEGKTFVYL